MKKNNFKKTVILKWFYATTMNHFSIWLWCVTKGGFYTIGDNQFSGWTQKKLQSTSQSQTCTKKWSWSLSGGLLPVYSLQLSKSRWNHYIWEVCLGNQWDALKTTMPATSTGQQKGPKSFPGQWPHIVHQHFKSWTNWAMKFCLSHHIHLTSRQMTTNSSSISATFCKENASTPCMRQKMLSKSSSNPEALIFILQK